MFSLAFCQRMGDWFSARFCCIRSCLATSYLATGCLVTVGVGLLPGVGLADDLPPVSEIRTARGLVDMRRRHDETIWSKEVQAQLFEDTFVKLWDALIHEDDKFAVLQRFDFDRILLPTAPATEALDHQISRVKGTGEPKEYTRAGFQSLLTRYENDGYQIIETEWHHQAFQAQTKTEPAVSTVSVLIHAMHPPTQRRFVVRGNLELKWRMSSEENLVPSASPGKQNPSTIDARGLQVYVRAGAPAFETVDVENYQCDSTGRTAPTTIHPIMVRDLNKDGKPEMIVGGFNRVYWNQGDFKFETRPFCEHPVKHVNAGVMGDFDGDGVEDYIAAGKNDYVYFFKGEPGGKFTTPGKPVDSIEKLRVPVSVAAGDIDGDGDVDIYVGQQKPGYQNGDIPTPYYDATDSYPSYLLLNDGTGSFTDATPDSGIGRKTLRRNFSATFVDLDDDGDLDLLLTSDFSGTDLFINDGTGKFVDQSDTMRPVGHAFGMSHSFGDYNLDGQLDFITIGMSSTTARRLEKMGLGREEFPEYNAARMKMGYGNRLFLRNPKGTDGFQQAEFNNSCARTGWSWGSTTLDFDRDGDQDIYIVNGQTSGQTTKDYCTRFWCHDVYYKRGERPDAAIKDLFGKMAPLFSGNAISWNGYEHNALLMNLGGNGFANIGFLMGCSFEFDSRSAVSADLDGDGRVDLLVEHRDTRKTQRNLHIVRNQWNDTNHWIGIRLEPKAGSKTSPFGAKVVVTLQDGRKLLQHCLAGHSVWAQHLDWIHFGLGSDAAIESVKIHWPGGKVSELSHPEVDQYHTVTPPMTKE